MFQAKRRKIERLDFILAGAQKSGTTALHYFLAKHPNITMGDQQEIHFFDAVKEEKTRIASAQPDEARRFAYVDRGFYAEQLERLFQFFPREQVKIVKFEEFREKQRETLASIFSFLELDPLRSVRSRDRNVVPYERAMNWEEKVFLYNLFATDIAKLEQMLGWNCSDWKL